MELALVEASSLDEFMSFPLATNGRDAVFRGESATADADGRTLI